MPINDQMSETQHNVLIYRLIWRTESPESLANN